MARAETRPQRLYTASVRNILTTIAVLAAAATTILGAQEPAPRPSFSEWLAGVRSEAVSKGIRPDIVDQALADIPEPLPIVIERDRAQAEVVQSFDSYLSRHVTATVVMGGREHLASHRELVDQIGERYGVSPYIIVAIWGLESNYGRFSGKRPTIAALATLAWDPRRSTFFRGELFKALEILNRGDIELAQMRGSWAGAMGQVQFMPSSYLEYAEDFDGDGRRDIWSTPGDVFASIANYLKGHGWTPGHTWGREVKVSSEAARAINSGVARRAGTCQATRDMTVALPATRWQELGVRLPNGAALPKTGDDAALVSGATRHFLVYKNYDAVLDYNCAHSYALSVGLLADAIGSKTWKPAPSKKTAPPKARATGKKKPKR
jgi:membrane-bound lytic murein transglycosylase B